MKNMNDLKEMTNDELEHYLALSTMDLNAVNFRVTEIEQSLAQSHNDLSAIQEAISEDTADLFEELGELEIIEDKIFEIEREIRYRKDNQIYTRSHEELESQGQAVLNF
jgi:peptidoglycan hydrolase CwlO-like protein